VPAITILSWAPGNSAIWRSNPLIPYFCPLGPGLYFMISYKLALTTQSLEISFEALLQAILFYHLKIFIRWHSVGLFLY